MKDKKQYRLKRWYPSLYKDIEEGIEVEYQSGGAGVFYDIKAIAIERSKK